MRLRTVDMQVGQFPNIETIKLIVLIPDLGSVEVLFIIPTKQTNRRQ